MSLVAIKPLRIHPTAVIAEGAVLGDGCEIGAYAVIGPGVTLGPGNVVGPHAVIEGQSVIGAANRFMQFCSIGAHPQDDHWRDGPANLRIGDHNVFREYVSVHGSYNRETPTRIGSHNHLMAGAHVAHDCRLGDRIHMANGATLGGHCEVADHAWLGGLCAVHQWVRVGAHAFLAGGAMVCQDAPPYCTVQGDRARLVALNTTGLSRAGFPAEEIAALRRAFRGLFLRAGAIADKIAAIRSGPAVTPAVEHLLNFLGESRRGVISRARAGG